ncbi:MAG: nucleotidyltransferase family protein [Candidatus Pacebacteria bacterium]|nr:nucleotidyltransferase family protein [Candidatus Paceibacterota bacterium]
MDADQIKIKIKKIEPYLKEKFLVKKIGVFGSYSRGEQRKTSDIDILVEFYEDPSLLKFLDLENYLADILDKKVDLVMRNSLKPNIGKQILNEVIYI